MDPFLSLIGLAKLVFGVFVGVVGISVAARLTARLSGFDRLDDGLRAGNVAVGISVAGSIVAMGILVQHAVSGTFGALDLLLHASDQGGGAAWIFLYAAVHVVVALGAGAAIVVIGIRVFVRLTPEVDEISEIHDGNVASALVLASVLIVMALLAQQGMETLLDGLLPLPTLGRDLMLVPN
ncbi:MAG: DUF350 domain-containing protein [Myxococcota bacterium]